MSCYVTSGDSKGIEKRTVSMRVRRALTQRQDLPCDFDRAPQTKRPHLPVLLILFKHIKLDKAHGLNRAAGRLLSSCQGSHVSTFKRSLQVYGNPRPFILSPPHHHPPPPTSRRAIQPGGSNLTCDELLPETASHKAGGSIKPLQCIYR